MLPHLINGLALGILFGLLALGFMLIVGVMEVINLAHGSLFALGAYVAVLLAGSMALVMLVRVAGGAAIADGSNFLGAISGALLWPPLSTILQWPQRPSLSPGER